MATKNISLTEEAYRRLARLKKENESFSKAINRLTNKKSLSQFAGVLSDESAGNMKEEIKEHRKKQEKLHEQKNKWLEKEFSK
ncbi:MAG: antitoxin VapB family protein [Candidatus Pacearchaeota archaeon]